MFRHPRRLACSFCGKTDELVAKLVAGPRSLLGRRVYICDACVAVASRIMAEPGDHATVSPEAPTFAWLRGLRRLTRGRKRDSTNVVRTSLTAAEHQASRP